VLRLTHGELVRFSKVSYAVAEATRLRSSPGPSRALTRALEHSNATSQSRLRRRRSRYTQTRTHATSASTALIAWSIAAKPTLRERDQYRTTRASQRAVGRAAVGPACSRLFTGALLPPTAQQTPILKRACPCLSERAWRAP